MKGSVFTEFLELVEQKFGMSTADRVVTKGCPFHRGYTSVGSYDHQELLSMVTELSAATGAPADHLVKVFGEHLFERFFQSYPDAFRGVEGTFELLRQVEQAIHVEVKKLSPDAELPHFEFPETQDNSMQIVYRSSRPFADLAEGMIHACIKHYHEDYQVQRQNLEGPVGTAAMFTLTHSRSSIDENQDLAKACVHE